MLLTIYTPTYNRSEKIKKLFESLLKQTCFDFSFLVVDDGSTDNTKEIVDELCNKAPFEVKYIYKKNEGVHTARDLAYKTINTELLVGIDSDDILYPTFVEDIITLWKKNKGEYIGIVAAMENNNGLIGTKFPSIKSCSYQDLTFKYKCIGDHILVFKTSIINKIPDLPVFEDEKLIGEGMKYVQLPNIPLLVYPKILAWHEKLEDGITSAHKKNLFRNLKGYRENYRTQSEYIIYFFPRFKARMKYVVTCLLLNEKTKIFDTKHKILTMLSLPFSLIAFLYIRIKQ